MNANAVSTPASVDEQKALYAAQRAESAARFITTRVDTVFEHRRSQESEFFMNVVNQNPTVRPKVIFDAISMNPKVQEIVNRYPHIFRKIALFWGTKEFIKLVADILTGKDRKVREGAHYYGTYLQEQRIGEGFRDEYMALLIAFQEYHQKLFPQAQTDTRSGL